jgi:hypothetical protein
MACKVRGCIEASGSLMIDENEKHVLGPREHDLLEEFLREMLRIRDAYRLEFLSGANVEQASITRCKRLGRLYRLDEHARIFFASGLYFFQYGFWVQAVITRADLGEGFIGAEAAARAATNMVKAKECPLRARESLEQFLHGHFRRESDGHGLVNMKPLASNGKMPPCWCSDYGPSGYREMASHLLLSRTNRR